MPRYGCCGCSVVGRTCRSADAGSWHRSHRFRRQPGWGQTRCSLCRLVSCLRLVSAGRPTVAVVVSRRHGRSAVDESLPDVSPHERTLTAGLGGLVAVEAAPVLGAGAKLLLLAVAFGSNSGIALRAARIADRDEDVAVPGGAAEAASHRHGLRPSIVGYARKAPAEAGA